LTDKEELESIKVIACDDVGKVIGTGRANFNSADDVQIRSMAVEEQFRHQGIGRMILSVLEDNVKKLGARRIIIDSRDSAVRFYESNGFVVIKESYLLYGKISHFTMVKEL
jgi:N-acetylglutamate synthase-like GNAT family acetyltransferase